MSHEEITVPPDGNFAFDVGPPKQTTLENAIKLNYLPNAAPSNFDLDVFVDEIAKDFNIHISSTLMKQLLSGYIWHKVSGPWSGSPFTGWQDFINGWRAWTQSLNPKTSDYEHFYEGFLDPYLSSLGSELKNNGNLSGDLDIFNTQPPVQPPFDFSNPNQNPLADTFTHFIKQFDWPDYYTDINNTFHPIIDPSGFLTPPGAVDAILLSFLGSKTTPHFPTGYFTWQWFLTTTALAQPSDQSSQPARFAGIPSYEAVFMAFGPKNANHERFVRRFKQFYEDQFRPGGPNYFVPSQFFHEWFDTIREENGTQNIIPSGEGSLTGNSSEKVIIINRLLFLLISIINTLQQVGISQANRLKFTTDFQKAYTQLQVQIPTFVAGSGGVIGGTSENAGKLRNELNASFNSILIDNMRTLRGLQEDLGKKQQADVNATNDVVNQQTDMCTTFIQQLSSLLSVILR